MNKDNMKLYHFTTKEKFNIITKNKLLRLSNLTVKEQSSNYDENDFRFGVEDAIDNIIYYKNDIEVNGYKDFAEYCETIKYKKQYEISKIKDELKNARELCTSKNKNNEKLINEFAKNDGYVFEIDVDELSFKLGNAFFAVDVLYHDFNEKIVPKEHIKNIYEQLYSRVKEFKKIFHIENENIESLSANGYYYDTLLKCFIGSIKPKDSKEDEEETRIIFPDISIIKENHTEKIGNFSSSIINRGLIHFVDEDEYRSFNYRTKDTVLKNTIKKLFYYEKYKAYYKYNDKNGISFDEVDDDKKYFLFKEYYKTIGYDYFYISYELLNIKVLKLNGGKYDK